MGIRKRKKEMQQHLLEQVLRALPQPRPAVKHDQKVIERIDFLLRKYGHAKPD